MIYRHIHVSLLDWPRLFLHQHCSYQYRQNQQVIVAPNHKTGQEFLPYQLCEQNFYEVRILLLWNRLFAVWSDCETSR